MKLVTSGGLLYSAAQAANADGSSGTYQSFDWVATIPEAANGGTNLSSATVPIGIGWDPVVVEVISNWDGGKTIAGFGKATGTIYASWVIKMWGAGGSLPCGDDSVISGYVTMVLQLNSELTSGTGANCMLTANAKVQWAWTNLLSTALTENINKYSFVITTATEEFNFGATTPTVSGDNPYIIVAGGETSNSWQAFGLNSWTFIGQFINFDGVTATAAGVSVGAGAAPSMLQTVPWTMPIQVDAANLIWTVDANANDETTLPVKNTMTATNHCWTAVGAMPKAEEVKRAAIAGYSGSITTCLKHAVDGYSFWGAIIMARVGEDWGSPQFTTANAAEVKVETYAQTEILGVNLQLQGTNTTVAGQAGLNTAQIRVIRMGLETTVAADAEAWFLATTSEYYANSVLFVSVTGVDIVTKTQTAAMTMGTYGSVWNFWAFKTDNTTATITLFEQTPNAMILCGVKAGKGNVFRGALSAAPRTFDALDISTFAQNTTAGFALIAPPAGGMGQFKGTTYGTTEKKYVQTICLSVQPMYYTAMYINLDLATGNGWVLSCYTGIPQCVVDQTTSITALTTTEITSCMDDPRYMNWRVMTIKVDIDGTYSWWRVDSYWNSTSTMFSSTWGVGVELSMNPFSDDDNNGKLVNLGQTFVFAYGDGSGIQLNHLAFGTTPVSTNTTAGSGTNTLTTAPTTFTNSSPNMLNQQYCGGSNLELTGTADTSALTATITDWSDGYKAKVTMNLEMILPGAAGGWRGVCMVYYSSVYVMDNTNGAICFAAQVNSATGSGPTDFGAGYLMDVASSVWQPPMNKSSLAPSSAALTGGKYDIVYAPSAATAFMYTEGYYASVTWYQPKYASSYSGIARYGKDDYLGAYCLQGAGSNSYFGATAASQKLTGAMYLAVGVISLGTALSLAI